MAALKTRKLPQATKLFLRKKTIWLSSRLQRFSCSISLPIQNNCFCYYLIFDGAWLWFLTSCCLLSGSAVICKCGKVSGRENCCVVSRREEKGDAERLNRTIFIASSKHQLPAHKVDDQSTKTTSEELRVAAVCVFKRSSPSSVFTKIQTNHKNDESRRKGEKTSRSLSENIKNTF